MLITFILILTFDSLFTCQVRAGSLYHENDDAQLFASWVSNCNLTFDNGMVYSILFLRSSMYSLHMGLLSGSWSKYRKSKRMALRK